MIFVCLGNKGEKYKHTRHNVGKMFGEYVTEQLKVKSAPATPRAHRGRAKLKIQERIVELENDWQVVFLNCYMNESGSSLKGLIKIKGWKIENLVVVHDDLDIPLGEFKIQTDRGSAGHRGVESVINALVTSNFKRIRIGIGRSEDIPEEKYVLMRFTKEERKELREVFAKVLREIRQN